MSTYKFSVVDEKNKTITFETNDENNILVVFADFLRAAGFEVDGKLVLQESVDENDEVEGNEQEISTNEEGVS
jgi:regulatory protein YycI of two-component signal transduction system YycFG